MSKHPERIWLTDAYGTHHNIAVNTTYYKAGDKKTKSNDVEYVLAAELAKHQWISVEDRLPDEREEVVVLWKTDKSVEFPNSPQEIYRDIGWINGIGEWNVLYNSGVYPVTHWMPLPQEPTND